MMQELTVSSSSVWISELTIPPSSNGKKSGVSQFGCWGAGQIVLSGAENELRVVCVVQVGGSRFSRFGTASCTVVT